MGMADRDFGLVLNLPIRADRLEDQQASVFLKADPRGAIPLLGEEALDMAQPTPLAPDQTGEGRGEEKATANCHETQAM
jgi:hypothetical protein